MNDSQLEVLSSELDAMLIQIAMQYKINSLSLSGVLLARLAHFNESFSSKDDYIQLLHSAADTISTNKKTVENVH